jgi:hypothetical protein
MKMPKNVDLSKSINREKVIEPSIANNEKNIECPPLFLSLNLIYSEAIVIHTCAANLTVACSTCLKESLACSKPATKSTSTATHCVEYFYYIQALLSCLL